MCGRMPISARMEHVSEPSVSDADGPPDGTGWFSRHHKHGPRWWRLIRLRFFRFREPLRSNRHSYLFYRTAIATLGAVIIILGLALVPLPGPGWLIVLAGIAIISTEFHWARRLLDFAKGHLRKWTKWVMARPLWIRLVIGGGGGIIFALLVYLVLFLTGVPSIVPAWLVPEWTGLRRL